MSGHFVIERLAWLLLLRQAILPFMKASSRQNIFDILMGLPELELVGLLLCFYLTAAGIYQILSQLFKRRRRSRHDV